MINLGINAVASLTFLLSFKTEIFFTLSLSSLCTRLSELRHVYQTTVSSKMSHCTKEDISPSICYKTRRISLIPPLLVARIPVSRSRINRVDKC